MTIMQMLLAGGRATAPAIGSEYAGGYYAGDISTDASGVATHFLIVAPKASGEVASKTWGPTTTTSITSVIDGPANSAALAALGSTYEAATWCEALSIGGFTDWYLPTADELTVLYYYLKPGTTANYTALTDGENTHAVSPQPTTQWTSGAPAQTSVSAFQSGGAECFEGRVYWTSRETSSSPTNAYALSFDSGFGTSGTNTSLKTATTAYGGAIYTRAVRRVAL